MNILIMKNHQLTSYPKKMHCSQKNSCQKMSNSKKKKSNCLFEASLLLVEQSGSWRKNNQKMLYIHKKMRLEKEFLPYYLMSLLYFQTSRIMDQFKLNPIRQNMERLIKEPHFGQLLIDQALEAMKDFGYAQIAYPQKQLIKLRSVRLY
ncbi:unnamed protein product (macronuclear) [Paramecium tetraurelia]|uniref:Uncharacterized protein n=1 Tax=Paramecium tetraurelia TaxID=5888 RepID=A0DCY2_PARTE|nr:uncharacterized protein GSPATT00015758001 [Paramecium tetraurelia]CAK80899.1 unnamed protein product [Paramecium tetraurelia]|eukprot:XP_001448296.1 hypothetical protein (macronuclear) [Paramecium tetraurelia strain d4-2]